MVTVTLNGIIFFIIVHIILYSFSEYMDILTFKKILTKNNKAIFYTYIIIDNIILIILLILAFLCPLKLKSYTLMQSLNLSYFITSIIILIFIAISYYLIFKIYSNKIKNKNSLIISGNIISHIFNNFMFIPEFICIRLLIKQKIEEINQILQPALPIISRNNNNSNSCADTNGSINNKPNTLNSNVSKKDETILVIVGRHKEKKNEDQNIENFKMQKDIKADGDTKSIDFINNKIQISNSNKINRNKVFLKKIDLKKQIDSRKVLNHENNNLGTDSLETDNNLHFGVKSSENIINRID